MHQSCRILSAACVWLTAVMTVIAGLPHFECRCPGGRLKPFCLGTPSHTHACCCCGGGPCCCRSAAVAGPAAEEPAGPSCCARIDEPSAPQQVSAGRPPSVQPKGCVRTLAADQQALTSEGFGAILSLEHSTVGPGFLAPVDLMTPPIRVRHSRDPVALHTPPDLVIVLRHLVI
jgi:hypothetical protein